MGSKRQAIDRIAITGIGLVTSVGYTAASTIAAIRGVIANFSEHETVMVNGDCYGTELSGAGIARLPEHIVPRRLTGVERAAALLAPGIRECTSGLSEDMLVSVAWRIRNWIDPDDGNFANNLNDKFRNFPVSIPCRDTLDEFALGRCLFFEDIIQAVADLCNGACRMALVACVDSLCETTVLDRLCEMGRLKSGTNPVGLITGEAAGVVLLELESHARKRKAPIHAFISAWGRGQESEPWAREMPSSARGLSKAFAEAFARLPGKGAEIDMVVADLNGETARACEWGITAGRIFAKDAKERELRHPADCVGDCGAAMGPVLIATAVGLMSGVSAPLNIVVSTSDEYGARRVLCLEKGDEPDKDAVVSAEVSIGRAILHAVVEQHVDEASSLWLVRNHLISAPHCGLTELIRHDERIEAHLHGLRLAGEVGWELCEGLLESNYPEDIFAPAVLAFEKGTDDRIRELLGAVRQNQDKARALISALGWLTYEKAEPHIKNFLISESRFHRYIGIAACALHRRDPGVYLDMAIDDTDPMLNVLALRAVGEVGGRKRKMISKVREYLNADNEDIRFSAAWSAALLGDVRANEALKCFVVPMSRYWESALNVVLRSMESTDALAWLKELSSDPKSTRMAVVGAGILGDPILVSWLIELMKTPELARAPGEAFTMITGVDIELEGMKEIRPERFNSGPNNDPDDDNVAMDPDENLPWPDIELIGKWWDMNEGKLRSGVRHLLGKPVTADHLRYVLKTGRQRQRAAAALELAILEPGRPLFEVRAPGFRQLEELRVKGEL